MTDSTSTPSAPDRGYPAAPESSRIADLAKSVRVLRTWLIVLTVIVALGYVTVAVVVAAFGVAWFAGFPAHLSPSDFPTWFETGAVPKGPALSSVASLPLDASGKGTIQGVPTGEASFYDTRGTFVLVLNPAPAGLPARTTVHVAFDRSTKVYRNGQPLGDPLSAMGDVDGPVDADPTAAGTVVVRFRIRDGRPFAERLDLSDEFPPGVEP